MDLKKVNKPILYDPMIIPRVKQYLEENVHQTYVDVGVMARHLQEKYRDYQRRKTAPFRCLVDQAYKTVLHSYGLDSNPSSEDDGNSDLELMDDRPPQTNLMNNMLTSMYAAGNSGKVPSNAENDGELIDISSDESETEVEMNSNHNHAEKTITLNSVKYNKLSAQIGKQVVKFSKDLTVSKKSGVVIQPLTRPDASLLQQDKNEFLSSYPQSPIIRYSLQPTKKRKIENKADGSHDSTAQNGKETPSLASRASKKYKKEFPTQKSTISFKDVGGIDKILRELCELLLHIKHPDVYKHIGLPPPRGFLLHGPPGTGKTLLAQAIAGQLEVPLIQVAATELVTGVSGESEERIRDLFEQAAAIAPCVLFIDEIDAISSNRMNAQKDMERRIVSQLLTTLDGLSKYEKGEQILVIGATNRAESLDPGLRRVGRFDQEISLGIPDRDARTQILRVICSDLRLEGLFNFEEIAALTPGYVGADLLALATRAASLAVKRAFQNKQDGTLLSSVEGPKSNYTIPVVNLTDDNILMEIDSVLDAAIQSDNESKDLDVEKLTADEAENENKTESVVNGQESDNKTVTAEGSKDELTKKGVGKRVTGDASEQIVADISTKSKNTPKVAEDVDITDVKPAETVAVIENAEINDTVSKHTLGEALLRNSTIKQTMGLDVMIKWLSNIEPLITRDEIKDLFITMNDFKEATKIVQPSAKREGFITVPDVTWNDIGSLRDIRQELQLAILAPVKYPNRLKILGLQSPSGVLLCGPPGCGKTLLAKAVANEAGINFISVKGPELLNMYVGESERAVRQCFQRARNSAPCVIFFDEFDALCPKRSDNNEGGASSRVVNQLLTEMDGVEERKGVFLMAATNRPDMVDAAVLRPGRLDKILYVGLPEEQDRLEILQAITKKGTKPSLAEDVSLENLARSTDSFTGADLSGLVRQAALQSLKDSIAFSATGDSKEDDLKVHKHHFTLALQHLRPSISKDDKIRYEKLRQKYVVVPGQ